MAKRAHKHGSWHLLCWLYYGEWHGAVVIFNTRGPIRKLGMNTKRVWKFKHPWMTWLSTQHTCTKIETLVCRESFCTSIKECGTTVIVWRSYVLKLKMRQQKPYRRTSAMDEPKSWFKYEKQVQRTYTLSATLVTVDHNLQRSTSQLSHALSHRLPAHDNRGDVPHTPIRNTSMKCLSDLYFQHYGS